jgi:hypothetical protein
MILIKRSKMTLAQLEATPEFRSMMRKEKFFVQTLIQTTIDCGLPDLQFACSSAYGNSGENARTMAYQVLRHKKVQAALRVYQNFGKSPRQQRAEEIQRARQQYIADVKAEMDAATGSKRERLVILYGQLIFGKFPKQSKKSKRGK